MVETGPHDIERRPGQPVRRCSVVAATDRRWPVVKNDVKDGTYDIMKISLDYLLRKYL